MRFYLRFWPYLLIVLEDLGLKSFESLPIASRVILGLFQGIAVRASGLTIISIGSLAPALQYVLFFCAMQNLRTISSRFLYVVLMYIGVSRTIAILEFTDESGI